MAAQASRYRERAAAAGPLDPLCRRRPRADRQVPPPSDRRMVATAVLAGARGALPGRPRRIAGASDRYHQFRRVAAPFGCRRASEQQLGYWCSQLTGMVELPLRTDRPRPEARSGRGARHAFTLSRNLRHAPRVTEPRAQRHAVHDAAGGISMPSPSATPTTTMLRWRR